MNYSCNLDETIVYGNGFESIIIMVPIEPYYQVVSHEE